MDDGRAWAIVATAALVVLAVVLLVVGTPAQTLLSAWHFIFDTLFIGVTLVTEAPWARLVVAALAAVGDVVVALVRAGQLSAMAIFTFVIWALDLALAFTTIAATVVAVREWREARAPVSAYSLYDDTKRK